MGQTTIVLMILTVISKIFGFVRESVMASYIGAGELKSIYTTAMTIPTIITSVIIVGIKSAYIPVYNKVKNEKGTKEADGFTSNLINILIVYGAISVILILLFADPISKIFSLDLSGSSLDLAANFSRILSLSVFLSLYASVIGGYLNIHGNFIDPAIIGFINNSIIIASTILYAKTRNPYLLIIGTFVGLNLQFIRFPFASKKLGFSYSKNIDFKDPYIKYLMVMILPIIFSSAANQLSVLIDNSMASAFFGADSISKIFYAKTMLNFITGVVTLSISTVTFPEIARLGQSGEIVQMNKSVSSAIVMSMLLVIPATLGMMALSVPIIKIAFERNAFLPSDTSIVASLLVAYAPSIIFAAFMQILTNAFYSIGNSRTPVIIIIIQQLLNIVMNVLLSRIFGLDGLAYATSISTIVASLILIFVFKKKVGELESNKGLKSIIKTLIASIIISILARIIYEFLKKILTLLPSLFIAVAIAGIIYIVLIVLLRVPEFDKLRKSFKNKIKGN